MKKILIVVFAYLILPFFEDAGGLIQAQTNLDSLWSVWQDESQADTNRIKAINKYIWNGYLFSQPDSAIYFAQLQLDFAEKRGLKFYMAQAYNAQAIGYRTIGDLPRAVEYGKLILQIGEEESDLKTISMAYNNLALSYSNLGNNAKAIEFHSRALKISEATKNQKSIAGELINIGNLYKTNEDYPIALEYLQRGITICKNNGYQDFLSNALTSCGTIYSDLGDYDKALDYSERALKINEEISDILGIAIVYNNIGVVYELQGEYATALEYQFKSLELSNEISDKLGLSYSYCNIGGIAIKQGRYQDAVNWCKKALKVSNEIGDISTQIDDCKCLYEAYKALNKGSLALDYHEKMLDLQDSLNLEETSKKLQQMEFEKQVLADSILQAEEERIVQIAHQEEIRKEEKTRNIAFISGGFILLLAIGLFGRLRYVRKSKAIIEEEKDRSENLLLNILPAEIAEELKLKGKADARDFDMVSILFTDFIEFTQTSEKLSASALVNEINVCFEAFDHILEKHKIEKIKTIGDSYMAAGGLPVPSDDSVKNTVLAALEMQEFISNRKTEKDAKNEAAFEMRVGIHTGPVVAGIVGVKKFQYDIWGDTVNTASRIENKGEAGKVNISQATYELLKDDAHFTFVSRGKIMAKGKGEMEMYFVSFKK